MLVDLHNHTTYSDGRLTPAQLMEAAKQANLGVIAITDHDTVAGCQSLVDSPSGLQVVCGIEFSTDDELSEVHILGLGVDLSSAQMLDTVAMLRAHRSRRIEKMVDKLQHLGYDLSVEDIFESAPSIHAAGRPHVAQTLVGKGYFTSVREAFDQLLHHNGPAYVPHFKLSVQAAVETIHGAGGIAILAHPGLIAAASSFTAALISGIDGLEVFYPQHTPEQVREFSELANEKQLLVSGGSDFHAIPGRYPTKPGVFAVPEKCVRSLLERLALL